MTRTLFRSCSLPLAAAGVALLLQGLLPLPAEAQTLQGSPASLDRQNAQAKAHDFTFLQTPEQVRTFVQQGYLVPVRANRDFDLHDVSFPYARPEVRVFIERLAEQYRAACGEKLVVTSLTRPASNQPWNASARSVHPTGMALDLRRSGSVRCRQWLESTLLSLEARGVLEAIYERNPPHYHVAVYPQPYAQYLASIGTPIPTSPVTLASNVESSGGAVATHLVARGENLTTIARRYGTTSARLMAENGLRNDRIVVGQRLTVPAPAGSVPVPPASAPTPARSSSAVLASAAIPPAAAAPGAFRTHTVGRGESLWTISRLYGVTEDALRAANGISGNRILVGDRLTIPAIGGGGGVALIEHRVAPGESLWLIANRHGTTVDEIRRTNGMGGTQIVPGQLLAVPVAR